MVVLALFGVTQTGLLDPISLLTRSLSTSVLPAAGAMSGGRYFAGRLFEYAWLSGAVFIAVLLANALVPRLFCRAFCPLWARCWGSSRALPSSTSGAGETLHPLQPVRGRLPGSVGPASQTAQVRMLCLHVLPRNLPHRRHYVPRALPRARHRPVSGHLPPAAWQTGVIALLSVPFRALLPAQTLSHARGHPASGFGAGGSVPGQVCPLRRVHEGLPDERHSAGAVRGGPGGDVYARDGEPNRLLRVQLHPLCSVCPTGAIREFTLDESLDAAGMKSRSSSAPRSWTAGDAFPGR